MACSPDCHRPSPSQAHCPVCHRTFGSVTGFDAHRRGAGGGCHDPAVIGYVADARGVLRAAVTEEQRQAMRHRLRQL